MSRVKNQKKKKRTKFCVKKMVGLMRKIRLPPEISEINGKARAIKNLLKTDLFDEEELKSLPWVSKADASHALVATARLRIKAEVEKIEREQSYLLEKVDKVKENELYKDLYFEKRMSKTLNLELSVLAKEALRENKNEKGCVFVVVRDDKDFQLLLNNQMLITDIIVTARVEFSLILAKLMKQKGEYVIHLCLHKEIKPDLQKRWKKLKKLGGLKLVHGGKLFRQKTIDTAVKKTVLKIEKEKKRLALKRKRLLESLKLKAKQLKEATGEEDIKIEEKNAFGVPEIEG